MWSLILVAAILPLVIARTCPKDTGPVFLVSQEHSDRHNHCFEFCGNNDCLGVLLFNGGCVALGKDDMLPTGEGRLLVEKHCVQGVESVQIVLKEENRVLLEHTEKIEKTVDEFHCMSLCSQQKKFACRSLMFYPESGDCLLNSVNSDTASTTDDTEGFRVIYMERRLAGDAPCIRSFSLLDQEAHRLRGDYHRENTNSWAECVSSCEECDKVIFGKGDCLILKESSDGKLIDATNHLVFENVCMEVETPSCPKEESLYVARGGYSQEDNRKCLKSCLNSDECRYAYKSRKGSCYVANHPEQSRKPVIERICPGLGPLESGVLFEERNKCPTGTGLKVNGLNLYQCMALCLSHPTSSCDSISFHRDSETCELLESSAILFSSKKPGNCQHFALGIIKENLNELKRKHIGLTGEQLNSPPMSTEILRIEDVRVRALAARKSAGPKIDVEKQEKDIPLEIQTKCGFSSIQITVKSAVPFSGDLFLRNAFESCSCDFKNNQANLRLTINETSAPCQAKPDGSVYTAVIVVKKSTTEDVPVITERDRMYTVTCDYSNHSAKVNTSRQLQIRDMAYSDMKIGGKGLNLKPVYMEMRAKRADHGAPVTIGQPVELSFQQDSDGYIVSNCIAENKDGRENITLIKDGCPTKTAKNYIVRGGIRKVDHGFALPLRAFKFRSGDVVRISCTLHRCSNCSMATCGSRLRRNLVEESGPLEQVHAELIVNEVQNNHDDYCFNKLQLACLYFVLFVLLGVQLAIISYMLWKRLNTESRVKISL